VPCCICSDNSRLRYLGFLTRLIHSRVRPEANLALMHRVAVHDSYCSASSLNRLLTETKVGSQLSLSLHLTTLAPRCRNSVELIRSSRRKKLDVPDSELKSLDSAVQRDLPLYADLKQRYALDQNAAREGKRRAAVGGGPVMSFSAWCDAQVLSNAQKALSSGPPRTVRKFHAAYIRGFDMSCRNAEESKQKSESRSSCFRLDPALAGLSTVAKPFARVVYFAQLVWEGNSVVLARVNVYKSKLDRSSKLPLIDVDVREGKVDDICFIRASEIGSPVNFADADLGDAKSGKYLVLDCSRK